MQQIYANEGLDGLCIRKINIDLGIIKSFVFNEGVESLMVYLVNACA
jgi:hypothetical protein